MKPVLEMQNITKTYPGVRALSHVSFDVRAGEIHGLMGENGAGKSTLIKVLSGAIKPDTGTITFKGESFNQLDPKQAMDLGIGIIYQEFNLIPYLSVAENIFLGHEFTKHGLIDDQEMIRKTTALMERLDVKINPRARVGELTVAYQQIVEIAKAVSREVELLVMDEPTAPLSEAEVEHLFALIDNLKRQNISIVYVSHRMKEIFELTNRITILRDGQYVGTVATEKINQAHLISLMVGREIGETFPPGGYAQDESVLDVENFTNERFNNITFSLKKGEVLGIGGLVGAGRTELGRALFGADPIQRGTLKLNGEPVEIRSPKEAIEKGLAFLPEDRKQQGLFLQLSVRHNTSMSALKFLTQWGLISDAKETGSVNEYVKSLGIKTPHIEQKVTLLSGGNQQKVVIAKWLSTRAQIFIFDEPTRGIDIKAKQEIYDLMRELTRQGKSIIMISSEMPELIGISDRILVMCQGANKGILQKEEATQDKVLELAVRFDEDMEEIKNAKL